MPKPQILRTLIARVTEADAFAVTRGCSQPALDRMRARRGGDYVRLLTDIVQHTDITPAFEKMLACGRFDMTYEWIVLQFQESGLFNQVTVDCARWKLRQFNVDC